MKKLLITGFEPFGGETINPSWEAVKLLPDTIGEFTLEKLLIPVVFGKAAKRVIKVADEIFPDVVLCIGQAGGRNAVTPEFVGINLRHAEIPDNDGNEPKDQPIIPNGKTAYFSSLAVRGITNAILQAGIPSKVSYSAGVYVCNDLLYTLLAHFEQSKTKVGFIHIPYCEEQSKTPSMSLKDIVKALTVTVENL